MIMNLESLQFDYISLSNNKIMRSWEKALSHRTLNKIYFLFNIDAESMSHIFIYFNYLIAPLKSEIGP